MNKLSIIIPVYNEADTIEKVLQKVQQVSLPETKKEIIVVNDESTDRTGEILAKLKLSYNFILFDHAANQGKGAAIRSGFAKVSGDLLIIQDADLGYNPEDWKKIIREFEDPSVQAVFGSRNINPHRQGYFRCVLGVKILTSFINRLFGSRLTDSYTCYKCFRSGLLKSLELNSSGFEIEAEITVKILKKGITIKEVPINYSPRKYNAGKKSAGAMVSSAFGL